MTRAAIGQGTQRGKQITRLNRNKQNILTIVREKSPDKLTVRQVQGILYDRHQLRWQRGDKDGPTGQWNYHLVQVELSLLLGLKYIRMTREPVEQWSDSYQRHIARPVPRYYSEERGLDESH